MKIEKINESQLKLILTQADLSERNIKLEDLTVPSEKTQALFHDIMEKALEEYDFVSENTPLMVEAVPVGLDGIMIIVTKMEHKNQETIGQKLSQPSDLRRFKKKPLVFQENEPDKNSDILVYSFAALDDVIHASLRIGESYHDASSLYKLEGRYFLVLQIKQEHDETKPEDLEILLGEYGQKHVSVQLSKYYLMEHAETIIENKAVTILSKSFGTEK